MQVDRVFSNPTALLVLTLVLAGLAASGKLSMSLARMLLVLAWVVSVVGFYNLPGLRSNPRLLMAAVAATAAALLVTAWWVQPKPTPVNVGILSSPAERVGSVQAIFPPQREILVQLGQSHSNLLFAGKAGGPLFSVAQESNLVVEEVDGELKVSSQIKDRSGNLLAELNRNEWTVFSPAVDRNYSKDALEVRGPHGRIVLQVRLLPDRIQLQGEWWSQDGVGLRVVGQEGENGVLYKMITSSDALKPPYITPIFRYPSTTHFGELAPK